VNINNRTFISVEAYADLITPEVADALRLGSVLDIGLQSINAQTTRAIQRPFKRDKWLRGIRLLRERNIAFNVYLISALPYETLGTFLQGIQFTLQERPLRIFFNELCLLNGTMLRRNAEQFGYEYDRDPPYFVHGNRWMPVPVLKFVQALAKVVERNYSNKAGVLLNSLPWMTKTNRYIGAEDSIVRHNLQDGIPTTAANTSAEQIELRAGPSVERRLLLQSAAQAMLAGFDRIILSADFANLNDAETIHNLVKRGVLHFRVPLNLERYQFDAEYNRMSTNALLQLTREYRIASGPQVRPIIEIDIQNGEHTDALRSVTDRLANRLGIIWNTYADEFLEAEHNRELVYDLMCSITPHRSWVRMSRNAMQYCLRRFDELPGEHDIGADAQRILDDMQSLELIGDGYVQTDFSRTPGLERANR
ncbi:MAG: radical SAM protein, partial [Leptospiraceae bacterium]|nr:radical SAM protein [Leptospiraceae bacterium]